MAPPSVARSKQHRHPCTLNRKGRLRDKHGLKRFWIRKDETYDEWFCKKKWQRGCFTIPECLFILPCNTVYLLVCLCVCCLYLQYSRPFGRSPLGLLLLPFHSRFLGLNAEAKKTKENTTYTNEEGKIFQQCNSVCFVSMYAQIHSVSSRWWFYQNSIYRPKGQSICLQGALCVFVVTHRRKG